MADVTCPSCGEPWNVAEPDPEPCAYCEGTGMVGARTRTRPCVRCRGHGTAYPTVAVRIAVTGHCPSCP